MLELHEGSNMEDVQRIYEKLLDNSAVDLISDMYKSLQDFCENQIPDTECPMWKEEFRRCGKQCRFRDIEDKMRKLGLDDMVVE